MYLFMTYVIGMFPIREFKKKTTNLSQRLSEIQGKEDY